MNDEYIIGTIPGEEEHLAKVITWDGTQLFCGIVNVDFVSTLKEAHELAREVYGDLLTEVPRDFEIQS